MEGGRKGNGTREKAKENIPQGEVSERESVCVCGWVDGWICERKREGGREGERGAGRKIEERQQKDSFLLGT